MKSNNLNKNATHPLQTNYWKSFREEWGNEVLETKYGILTLHKIPPGPEALWGRWPLPYKLGMFIKGPTPTKEMLKDLKKIAKVKNLIFIKLEPNVASGDGSKQYVASLRSQVSSKERAKLIQLLKQNGCVPGKTLFTPTSFWIDLTKSEEDLMKGFHPKTRYNIRYAERKGVKVVENNSDRAFEKYLDLTRETVERQGFYAHNKKYHRLMWKHLNKLPTAHDSQPIAHLLTATFKKEVLTCWIVFVWKDFLYYPYGASSEKYKNVQANSLMMWEAIKFGKKLGLKTFDLWGREPGKGFTKFKEGYNPQVVEFLGTWDLVVNKPLYNIYRVSEYLRWKLLRIPAKLGLVKPRF